MQLDASLQGICHERQMHHKSPKALFGLSLSPWMTPFQFEHLGCAYLDLEPNASPDIQAMLSIFPMQYQHSLIFEVFSNQERKFQSLLLVQPRITERRVSLLEITFLQSFTPSNTLCNRRGVHLRGNFPVPDVSSAHR